MVSSEFHSDSRLSYSSQGRSLTSTDNKNRQFLHLGNIFKAMAMLLMRLYRLWS